MFDNLNVVEKMVERPSLLVLFTVVCLLCVILFWKNRHIHKGFKYMAGFVSVYLPCLWGLVFYLRTL